MLRIFHFLLMILNASWPIYGLYLGTVSEFALVSLLVFCFMFYQQLTWKV